MRHKDFIEKNLTPSNKHVDDLARSDFKSSATKKSSHFRCSLSNMAYNKAQESAVLKH